MPGWLGKFLYGPPCAGSIYLGRGVVAPSPTYEHAGTRHTYLRLRTAPSFTHDDLVATCCCVADIFILVQKNYTGWDRWRLHSERPVRAIWRTFLRALKVRRVYCVHTTAERCTQRENTHTAVHTRSGVWRTRDTHAMPTFCFLLLVPKAGPRRTDGCRV